MKQWRNLGIVAIASALAFVAAVQTWLWYGYYDERRETAALVERIHQFERQNHRLPNNLSEIGIPDGEQSGGPFYQVTDSHNFEIFYSDAWHGFFSTYAYSSATNTWSFVHD